MLCYKPKLSVLVIFLSLNQRSLSLSVGPLGLCGQCKKRHFGVDITGTPEEASEWRWIKTGLRIAVFSYSFVVVEADGAEAEQCLWLSPGPQGCRHKLSKCLWINTAPPSSASIRAHFIPGIYALNYLAKWSILSFMKAPYAVYCITIQWKTMIQQCSTVVSLLRVQYND